jgi:hypothetical protein
MTELGTLGGNYAEAQSINPAGYVAGIEAEDQELPTHATLWRVR